MATIPISVANNVFGAKLVGGLLNSALWGMSCIQVFAYFTGSKRKLDLPIIQHAITGIVFMNTVHAALASHVVYWYIITQYGNPTSVGTIVKTESASNCVTEITICVVRFLFARRLWKLSNGKIWLALLVCVLSVANMGVGVALAVLIGQVDSVYLIFTAGGIYGVMRRTARALSAVHIVTEVLITFPISYYLYTLKGGIPRTNSLINVLIQYTIGTGGVVVLFSVAALILNVQSQNTDFGNTLYMTVASLYVNCYLAGVNFRNRYQDRDEDPISLHISQIGATTPGYSTTNDVNSMAQKKTSVI